MRYRQEQGFTISMKQYYSEEFGWSDEPVNDMKFLSASALQIQPKCNMNVVVENNRSLIKTA